MADNDYRFLTRWRVPASAAEVAEVIGDPLALPRWWPEVYLSAVELEPGDSLGVGRLVDLHTRGWLPYTLRWRFRVEEVEPERRFVIRASGDFEGTGVWSFAERGAFTDVEFLWTVRAEKPLLRRLSFALRPIFSANHAWAMRRGLDGLHRELARRRGAGAALA